MTVRVTSRWIAMQRPIVLWATLAAAAAAQTPSPAPSGPAFEVVSVKTAAQPERESVFCLVPCSPGERLRLAGTRVDIRFMSLYRLIYTAYRVKPYQLNAPD